MLNLWIGKNDVMPNISIGDISNLDKSCDFDCYFPEDRDSSINVLLGENGAGKSFIGKTIAYLAYIYFCSKKMTVSKIHSIDADVVINSLLDAKIGSLDDSPKNDCISLQTSYREKKDLNPFVEQYYNVRLGQCAQSYFENHRVVFYSNSQFPSNDFFFSKGASSFAATNVDVIFWNLKKSGPNKSNLKISLWQNKSSGIFGKEEFSPDRVRDLFDSDEKIEPVLQSIKYVHRNIFMFDQDAKITWNDIKQSLVYQVLLNQYKSFERHPIEKIALKNMSLKDYYILLLFKRRISNIDFELLKGNIREKYLSSKERYDLVLDCLLNMDIASGLFIIDEPENSTHLKIQKKIACEFPAGRNVLAMTHSPEFVIGLKSMSSNIQIWSVYKNSEEIKSVEHIESALITESLDATAADFFGCAPYLKLWNKINSGVTIDTDSLMTFDDFYSAIKNLK